MQAREHHGISFHGEAGEGLAAVFTDLRHSILRESIHLLGLGKVRCAVSDESHAAENERERERVYRANPDECERDVSVLGIEARCFGTWVDN